MRPRYRWHHAWWDGTQRRGFLVDFWRATLRTAAATRRRWCHTPRQYADVGTPCRAITNCHTRHLLWASLSVYPTVCLSVCHTRRRLYHTARQYVDVGTPCRAITNCHTRTYVRQRGICYERVCPSIRLSVCLSVCLSHSEALVPHCSIIRRRRHSMSRDNELSHTYVRTYDSAVFAMSESVRLSDCLSVCLCLTCESHLDGSRHRNALHQMIVVLAHRGSCTARKHKASAKLTTANGGLSSQSRYSTFDRWLTCFNVIGYCDWPTWRKRSAICSGKLCEGFIIFIISVHMIWYDVNRRYGI